MREDKTENAENIYLRKANSKKSGKRATKTTNVLESYVEFSRIQNQFLFFHLKT